MAEGAAAVGEALLLEMQSSSAEHKCVICMEPLDDGREVARPAGLHQQQHQQQQGASGASPSAAPAPGGCSHVFCVPCITIWAQNTNACPLDRTRFSRLEVLNRYGGTVVRSIAVEERDPQVPDEEDGDGVDAALAYTHCQICGGCDNEGEMLLCDICDDGYHIMCLDPPLEDIPEGDWFCAGCGGNPPQRRRAEQGQHRQADARDTGSSSRPQRDQRRRRRRRLRPLRAESAHERRIQDMVQLVMARMSGSSAPPRARAAARPTYVIPRSGSRSRRRDRARTSPPRRRRSRDREWRRGQEWERERERSPPRRRREPARRSGHNEARERPAPSRRERSPACALCARSGSTSSGACPHERAAAVVYESGPRSRTPPRPRQAQTSRAMTVDCISELDLLYGKPAEPPREAPARRIPHRPTVVNKGTGRARGSDARTPDQSGGATAASALRHAAPPAGEPAPAAEARTAPASAPWDPKGRRSSAWLLSRRPSGPGALGVVAEGVRPITPPGFAGFDYDDFVQRMATAERTAGPPALTAGLGRGLPAPEAFAPDAEAPSPPGPPRRDRPLQGRATAAAAHAEAPHSKLKRPPPPTAKGDGGGDDPAPATTATTGDDDEDSGRRKRHKSRHVKRKHGNNRKRGSGELKETKAKAFELMKVFLAPWYKAHSKTVAKEEYKELASQGVHRLLRCEEPWTEKTAEDVFAKLVANHGQPARAKAGPKRGSGDGPSSGKASPMQHSGATFPIERPGPDAPH